MRHPVLSQYLTLMYLQVVVAPAPVLGPAGGEAFRTIIEAAVGVEEEVLAEEVGGEVEAAVRCIDRHLWRIRGLLSRPRESRDSFICTYMYACIYIQLVYILICVLCVYVSVSMCFL